MSISAIAAWAGHIIAWATVILLVFVPTYEGVSSNPTLGGQPGELVRTTETLIEVNGLRVIPLLMVPILVSGFVVWVVRRTDTRNERRKALLWVPTILFLGLCLLSILSVGLLYLPTGLALLVASITAPTGRQQRE